MTSLATIRKRHRFTPVIQDRSALHECRPGPKAEPVGEHEWQIFKQRIQVDASTGLNALRYQWYFIIKACIRCHMKQYLDLRKEG